MPTFASKPSPSSDKLRGGYYTPDALAELVATWAAVAGPRQLEPSCGDGAILRRMASIPGSAPLGVEIVPDEAAKAAVHGEVVNADFFSWLTGEQNDVFDGVAGNPPYIRFGSWDEESRKRAMDVLRQAGLPTSKLTNAWVPFVVGAVLAVRQGGRVALVLPAELLQVGYAKALRAWLVDNCSEISLVSFERLVFPGILQEVVVLLAVRGAGPATIGTVEFPDATSMSIDAIDEQARVRAPLHDSEKWTKYYLPAEDIELVRSLRVARLFVPIGEIASVDVGVVTGRNAFFCMTAQAAMTRGLQEHTVPLVSRSQQVRGLRIGSQELAALDELGATTRLLLLDETVRSELAPAVAAYVAEGEAEEVHTGYKCRIRKQWWRVPSVWVPDAFMLRQISTHPRIAANESGATSTDTVHRVRVKSGVSAVALSVAALNSITFALCEVVGRSYGGGILELEPSEAEELLVPDPRLVTPDLIAEIDILLRAGRVAEAVDAVDSALLVASLGISRSDLEQIQGVWVRMRDRRLARGRRSTAAGASEMTVNV